MKKVRRNYRKGREAVERLKNSVPRSGWFTSSFSRFASFSRFVISNLDPGI